MMYSQKTAIDCDKSVIIEAVSGRECGRTNFGLLHASAFPSSAILVGPLDRDEASPIPLSILTMRMTRSRDTQKIYSHKQYKNFRFCDRPNLDHQTIAQSDIVTHTRPLTSPAWIISYQYQQRWARELRKAQNRAKLVLWTQQQQISQPD